MPTKNTTAKNTAPAAAQAAAKKTGPTHRILQIEPRGESKPYWREVGVAFQNNDGSLNLKFAVIPMFGEFTVQVREITERDGSAD